MWTGLKAFFKDRSGISATEFALISPIAIAIAMSAITYSFKLLDRQRLDAAVTASAYYLADKVLDGEMSGFQPTREMVDGAYEFTPGQFVQTARFVLSDAYRSSATLTITELDVFCGCPQNYSGGDVQTDQPFFTRFTAEAADEAPLCSMTCPDRSRARVLAEIDVTSTSNDFLGQEYTLEKQIVMRLR